MFETFDSFKTVYYDLTKDFRFMVSRKSMSSSIQDKLKWYAPKISLNDDQIQQFNLDTICQNPLILITSPRNTGKTSIVSDIISHLTKKNKYTECVIISPSEKIDGYYNSNHNGTVYYKYDGDIIQNLVDKIESIDIKERSNTLLILDDCMPSKKIWMCDKVLKYIFMNNKSLKLSIVLTMQYPLGITPELRTNFDYIFMGKTYENKIKNICYENYFGIFESFDLFNLYHNELIKNDKFMIYCNRPTHANRNLLKENIKWYRSSSYSITTDNDNKTFDEDNISEPEILKDNDLISNIDTSISDLPIINRTIHLDILNNIVSCNLKITNAFKKYNYDNDKKLNIIKKITKCNNSIMNNILDN